MTAAAWMLCVILLGQVGGGDRYSGANTNPFAPGGGSAVGAGSSTATGGNNGAGANPSNSGLVPVIPPSGAESGASQKPMPTGGQSTNPFGASPAPLGGGSTYPAAARGANVPAASTSPWQTTSGGAPNTPQNNAAGGLKPAAMMRAMLAPPPSAGLPGNPLSLADAVLSASSRAEQTERVDAYWDLCSSVADYYLGEREKDEFRRVRASRSGPVWQEAEQALVNRVATSQAAAVASQFRLASLIGMPGSMPLPADIPHCGDYHTRYDQIFAGRSSAEAQQLAVLLPKRYAELKDAAAAVTRAEQWLNTTAARDNGDGVETVRALELLALRRRAFVQIARDYNRRIARYTELSTPGQVDSDRLVSMLIKRDGAATATRSSGPIPFNRQSQNAPSLPRTFDEGWEPAEHEASANATVDDAIRQASGESNADHAPGEERSLLVNPQ